jgi:hypothetical protein
VSAPLLARVRVAALPPLDATAYARHALHGEGVVWSEKNCYVDLWIELLHALGHPPEAMLPFVIGADFEGDQWAFFKPSHDELRDLYGVEVQELTVWRPLLDHAIEHLAAGKLIATEADAWWLPDTEGTDYRQKRSKTTIVLADIDVAAQRLGYFHNAGYYTLQGEDFVQTFGLAPGPHPAGLPLFAELIRQHPQEALSAGALREASRQLWRKHLRRVPSGNPVARFAERFAADLPMLQARGMDHYHAWAFGTVRQLGAACELAAANLRWLGAEADAPDCPAAEAAFQRIALDAKTLILKGARAVASRKAFDPVVQLAPTAAAWSAAVAALSERYGR